MSEQPIYDEVLIRPIDIERDAADLAEMWMASELAWPDGLNRGVPVTPELAAEWENEGRVLTTYVAELGGKVVGYCAFQKGEGKKEGEPYLAVLNVHPGYHGHSIGRKLIQRTIERSVAEGWKYQTLHTWSANYKAVPAYKKTGHFWAPDSSVLMENFVPGALQLSLAQPFFERHDWYRCYVREIDQGWDDERWQGLAVYTYRWEADSETLLLRYDREARGLVSVETDTLELSAVIDTREPLADSTCKMNWRAVNKGQSPISISLRASGDKGLSLDYVTMFTLAAGESKGLEAEVKVADDAASSTDRGTAPAVLTDWLIDENRVEMKTGVKPKKPVTLSIFPEAQSLIPGTSFDANLELHNELKETVQVTARLFAQEGLQTDWCERVVILPSEGYVSLPVKLTALAEGVLGLDVRLTGTFHPISESFKVFSVAAGGLVMDQIDKDVRIETDRVRVNVASKNGEITILDKTSTIRLANLSLTVAPPYYPLEFETVALDSSWVGSRAQVSMRGEASHYEGLVLNAQVEISATGLGTVKAWIENQGTVTHDVGISLVADPGDRNWLRMAHPTCRLNVIEPANHYPAGSSDDLRDPIDYREPWIAWDRSDKKGGSLAGGVAWDASLKHLANEWRISFLNKGDHLSPGEKSNVVQYAFCCTPGSWQVAAELLRGWTGTKADEAFGSAVQVLPERDVLLTLDDQVDVALTVSSVRRLPLEGSLTLDGDKELCVSPGTFSLAGVARDHDTLCEAKVVLNDARQGIYGLKARLELPTEEGSYPLSVVRIGSPHTVEVGEQEREGQSVWQIDNGADRFTITPDFGPSVMSWVHAGEEMLSSPFPEPDGFAWTYPTFGGLAPIILPAGTYCWEGFLYLEKSTAQEVETHWGGLDWRGVRLTCIPQHKDLKGVRVELDYTTVGKSSVLRVVSRLTNLRDTTSGKIIVNHTGRFNLGDDCRALVGRTPDVTRQPTNRAAFFMGQPWAMVTRPANGLSAILVSLNKDACLADYGQNGRLLSTESEVRLAGRQTIEFTSFYILAPNSEEASKYRILRDIDKVS